MIGEGIDYHYGIVLMSGLPTPLYTRCREILLQCREFENYRNLRAIFITPELRPFRYGLREADNPASLVELILEYSLEKKGTDGLAILPTFLSTIQSHYPSGDALRDEIRDILPEIRRALQPAKPSPIPSTKLKNLLFDRLLLLNYRQQIQLVKQVIDNHQIAPRVCVPGYHHGCLYAIDPGLVLEPHT